MLEDPAYLLPLIQELEDYPIRIREADADIPGIRRKIIEKYKHTEGKFNRKIGRERLEVLMDNFDRAYALTSPAENQALGKIISQWEDAGKQNGQPDMYEVASALGYLPLGSLSFISEAPDQQERKSKTEFYFNHGINCLLTIESLPDRSKITTLSYETHYSLFDTLGEYLHYCATPMTTCNLNYPTKIMIETPFDLIKATGDLEKADPKPVDTWLYPMDTIPKGHKYLTPHWIWTIEKTIYHPNNTLMENWPSLVKNSLGIAY